MRDDSSVRTTIDLDTDILLAAKEIALTEGSTLGAVISKLARKGLEPPTRSRKIRNGVPLLARRPAAAPRPTMTLVNDLRDSS